MEPHQLKLGFGFPKSSLGKMRYLAGKGTYLRAWGSEFNPQAPRGERRESSDLYVCIMLHTQHNNKFKSFYILFVMCICVCLLYAVHLMSAEEASELPGNCSYRCLRATIWVLGKNLGPL